MRLARTARFAAAALTGGLLAAAAGCGGSAGGGNATPTGSAPPTMTLTSPEDPGVGHPGTDWPTYGHDFARTGVAANTAAAGPLSVSWRARLDGAVYGQPLLVGSTVIAATENDSIYALDQATGTVRLKAIFKNERNRLWPGQFVDARVLLRTERNAMTIPSAAVQIGPDGPFTYVVKGDSTVEVRPLHLGGESGGNTIVTEGLTSKERVVTTNQYRLQAGARVRQIEDAGSARAVVLAGDGQYFSAGADLKEMASMDPARAPAVVHQGQELFRHLSQLAAPSIAAVNGLALGGGLELALACDLRIAGESAKFGAPEVTFGLMPAYGGTQRLPRTVGLPKAKVLIFTGGMIPAAEALRIGLINKVVPAGQELRAARDLAHTIGQRAPKAVQAAKRAIGAGIERPLSEGTALELELFRSEVLSSHDLVEGIRAFAEKRPPKFRGE